MTALRPTEYTAALIQVLRARAGRIRGASVFEAGVGSGVVLAALGGMGAASLSGVDVEPDAIDAASALLHGLGYRDITDLHRGDLWAPVAGRRFDVVAGNLPHFPMAAPADVGVRKATWSDGGPDGRARLDAFLDGLADHLTPGGLCVINHNGFAGLSASRERLARHGLALRVALSVLVYVPIEKMRLMTARVRDAEEGRTIFTTGPHTFAQMHVVDIAAPGTLAALPDMGRPLRV